MDFIRSKASTGRDSSPQPPSIGKPRRAVEVWDEIYLHFGSQHRRQKTGPIRVEAEPSVRKLIERLREIKRRRHRAQVSDLTLARRRDVDGPEDQPVAVAGCNRV